MALGPNVSQRKLKLLPDKKATGGEPSNSWVDLIRSAREQHGDLLTGAVYRVYCQKTTVSYVGQTADLYLDGKSLKPTRIKSHYAALKKGCHPCKELQSVWDAENGKSFADECLEFVTLPRQPINDHLYRRRKLTEREKFWQGEYSAKTGRSVPENRHYSLKAEELKLLKESGIINNATLIYFILKLKNPWCDRPIRVYPLEISAEWGIPESSAYEAILKLRDAEVIEISKAEIVVQWHSQQADYSGSPGSFQDSRMDSGKSERILESQKEFQDSRMDSGKSENRSSESAQGKDSRLSQY